MKITKKALKKIILAELTNFDRSTGRPQTEEGRRLAAAANPPNKKNSLAKMRKPSQLQKLKDMAAMQICQQRLKSNLKKIKEQTE